MGRGNSTEGAGAYARAEDLLLGVGDVADVGGQNLQETSDERYRTRGERWQIRDKRHEQVRGIQDTR